MHVKATPSTVCASWKALCMLDIDTVAHTADNHGNVFPDKNSCCYVALSLKWRLCHEAKLSLFSKHSVYHANNDATWQRSNSRYTRALTYLVAIFWQWSQGSFSLCSKSLSFHLISRVFSFILLFCFYTRAFVKPGERHAHKHAITLVSREILSIIIEHFYSDWLSSWCFTKDPMSFDKLNAHRARSRWKVTCADSATSAAKRRKAKSRREHPSTVRCSNSFNAVGNALCA